MSHFAANEAFSCWAALFALETLAITLNSQPELGGRNAMLALVAADSEAGRSGEKLLLRS